MSEEKNKAPGCAEPEVLGDYDKDTGFPVGSIVVGEDGRLRIK